MNIDWSKAPEGTTHYDVAYGLFCNSNGFWNLSGIWVADSCQNGWGTSRYSARPGAWNGEGLPPVGTVCELRCKTGGWGEAEIKYQGRAICVWLWIRRDGNTDQVEWAENPERMEFRPLRSPEQIAAEEREKAINEMSEASQGSHNWPDAFAKLYDSGYRKQVKP